MNFRAANSIRLYLNISLKHSFIQSRRLKNLKCPNSFLLSRSQTSGDIWRGERLMHVSCIRLEERVVKPPPFADSVSEGDIKYSKVVGDQVSEDEIVCEIETDKTSMPVPSPVAGVLLAYLVEDGSKVVANQDIFTIKVSADTTTTPSSASPPSSSSSIPLASHAPSHSEAAEEQSSSLKVVVSPPFADSVSEGDVKFIKGVGDEVNEDELVMEIETDKTSMPITAPFRGVIKEMLVQDGDKITANTPLFKITIGGQSKPSAQPAITPSSKPSSSDVTPTTSNLISSTATTSITPQIAPPLASSHHLKDMPGLRTEERVKMSRMRLRIAERLKEAQNTCAMLTTFNEVDMTNIMQLRSAYKHVFLKKHGVKLGFMSPFLKASAYALTQQASINAVIDEKEIVYRDYVDISVAVATPKGLVVPVLRNVELMNCADIEKALVELGEKAKKGNLAVEDMDGGTFTVSNGGVFGSLMGTPIINPPQSAILGMHGIFERPVAVNGEVQVRPMMYLALTYDHRLVDGREAVLFVRKIKEVIEDPRCMLLDL